MSCCFLSCNQQGKGYVATSEIISFDKVGKSDFEISDLTYVPLETTEQSLIGSIDKIVYRNDKYYILDKTLNKSVYIFDKTGAFIYSINKSGEGPGEYLEMMDMDVDNNNNIYVADNGKMSIIKYINASPDTYETISVGEHFFEFRHLNGTLFVLRDIFGKDGQKMNLAIFDSGDNSLKPLLSDIQKDINELDILRCSKHYLYHAEEGILYNERFTPDIYSVDKKGQLHKKYTISSANYAPRDVLKGLEKNPVKFIQESKYIKDVIGLHENDKYFVCMPFMTPSASYLLIPKDTPENAKTIDLSAKKELVGTSQIELVAENKFVVVMNYSESQAENLKNNPQCIGWNEESNPILVLFNIQ